MILNIVFGLLFVFIIYSLYKNRRKKVKPFPEEWHALLLKHVHFYKSLSTEKQQEFQERMMQFLNEVYLDSVDLEIQDLDKILIAASAVIPVFGFKEWHYNNLSGVLLYPNHFNNDLDFEKGAKLKIITGIVGNGRLEKQMILSQKALYRGFKNASDKSNTAIHEFIHLIDKMDGITDGVPERLLQHQYVIPWLKLVHNEMEMINNNHSDIRSYGGINEAEFFAVASEYFFERPDLLQEKHPELYKMLADCFHQHFKQN